MVEKVAVKEESAEAKAARVAREVEANEIERNYNY